MLCVGIMARNLGSARDPAAAIAKADEGREKGDEAQAAHALGGSGEDGGGNPSAEGEQEEGKTTDQVGTQDVRCVCTVHVQQWYTRLRTCLLKPAICSVFLPQMTLQMSLKYLPSAVYMAQSTEGAAPDTSHAEQGPRRAKWPKLLAPDERQGYQIYE
jgi:hypothetical protein